MKESRIHVGLIGHGFMGKAHSHALHDLTFFCDVPCEPVRHTLCGIGGDLEATAKRYGWRSTTGDWRDLMANPEIQAVSICAPGNLHAEMAVAAVRAGKHVLCEKPLANSAAEAQGMLRAAVAAGVCHAVNFNYRKLPAVALARRFIETGALGEIRFFRGTYFQDWTLDPEFPWVWRFDKQVAGAGSMADKGSHIVDLARYLAGEIAEVAAAARIFIPERSGRPVTTDDAAAFLCRFESGALGIFGTNRMSAGHKNALGFEVNGSRGSLIFDLERLNELQVYLAEDGPAAGFRTILATDAVHHPYAKHWWPPGHTIGWEHTFVHQYLDFFSAIVSGEDASPSFVDGYRAQVVLDAVEAAANSKAWVCV